MIFNAIGTIEIYMDCLRAICGKTSGKSMVDLCCAYAPNTPRLGFEIRNYIDVIPRTLDHQEEQRYFLQRDVLTFGEVGVHYDVAICSDGIEHLTKENGLKLLEIMKCISDKQIIFTPLGPYAIDDGDNPEGHHSAWYPEEFTGEWSTICFPNYHPTLGVGAFFAWRGGNYEEVKTNLFNLGYERYC